MNADSGSAQSGPEASNGLVSREAIQERVKDEEEPSAAASDSITATDNVEVRPEGHLSRAARPRRSLPHYQRDSIRELMGCDMEDGDMYNTEYRDMYRGKLGSRADKLVPADETADSADVDQYKPDVNGENRTQAEVDASTPSKHQGNRENGGQDEEKDLERKNEKENKEGISTSSDSGFETGASSTTTASESAHTSGDRIMNTDSVNESIVNSDTSPNDETLDPATRDSYEVVSKTRSLLSKNSKYVDKEEYQDSVPVNLHDTPSGSHLPTAEEVDSLRGRLHQELAKREETEARQQDLDALLDRLKQPNGAASNGCALKWRGLYQQQRKASSVLNDTCSAIRRDIDVAHQKLLRKAQNLRKNTEAPSKKLTLKLNFQRSSAVNDDLMSRVAAAKLIRNTESKLRDQAELDVKMLRKELAQKRLYVSRARQETGIRATNPPTSWTAKRSYNQRSRSLSQLTSGSNEAVEVGEVRGTSHKRRIKLEANSKRSDPTGVVKRPETTGGAPAEVADDSGNVIP